MNNVPFTSSRILAVTTLAVIGAVQSYGQVTNIAVESTTLQPSVKRLGINLSFQTFYDSGQMTKNLVFRNPGFEGEIYQSTIRCASGTATTCIDENPYSAWPDAFWNGAVVEFFYGKALYRVEFVTSFTGANGTTGGKFVFGGTGIVPAPGDYMIVRMKVPGNAAAGWWTNKSGSGAIATNMSDLPIGTTGKQTIALAAPGAADSASVASYFDSTAGHTFVALNGTYQLSFKAKGTGGSNTIALNLQRAGLASYLNQDVKLTTNWDTYTLTFNASETGLSPGTVGLTFATKGQDSFLLDDVSLIQSNSDPANITAFRDPVVNALKTLNPGVLRFWAYQLGDTLDNLIASPFARQRAGYSAWATSQDSISYGLGEFLQLCETIGADPWIVVPSTFSSPEASNLIEYLSGSTSTPYGAKRAAGGHSAPWVSSFSKIHLEFGNEAWNGGFKGGSIEYSAPYGQRAQTLFGAMRSNSAYISSAFDLVLGGQAAWPSRNQDIQNNCYNNDTFALAPYMMNRVDTYSNPENLFGPMFAEAEAFQTPSGTAEGIANGLMLQNVQALQASQHPVPIALYEMNLSTTEGSISQEALNVFASSLGAGLAVVDNMLQQMRQGVMTQSMFALQQNQFVRPDGKTVPLWGSVIDMGVTDRRRPQFLALQLANQAIGSNSVMLKTTHSGADPTWDQPLVNTVQLTGAHYLQSFAFSSGSQRSLVVFNLQRDSSLPVSFTGPNAPFGTVTMQRLTSNAVTDTNEDAGWVNITSQILPSFNAANFTLPRFSMTVFSWSAGANPAPLLSAVTATAVSATSAIVKWTTDQRSTSQVQFGTTSAYGSLSIANGALTTAHSITLIGLTPGTSYNCAAQSSNSEGLLAFSGNLVFTTPTTGPIISSVAATSITANTATISWTTDKPSSSQVSFGTGAGYGSVTPYDASPVTSHTVSLTGLTPGVTYNYAATSTIPAGTTTSPNFTFGTPAASLVISSVTSSVTSTSATISWNTDKLASSQATYGTTLAYGSYSTYDITLVTLHSVQLTGLTPGTTYNYAVTSAVNGGSATSANFTFTTPGSVPVISAVTTTAITSTSAVINWTTDRLSTSQSVYGTTTAYGSYSTYDASPVTAHGVTVIGLTPGTTYNFAVTSVAPGGGTANSGNFTFTTLTGAPVISLVTATAITGTTATISWTTDKASTSQVAYGTSTAYGYASAFDSSPVTLHSVTLSGLNPGTIYNYIVGSVGSAGSTVSSNYLFSTSSGTIAIGSVNATAITGTSATITWTTDQPSTSQALYGPTAAYGIYSVYIAAPVTQHAVTLSGLNSGTTYNYAVTSSTSGGTATSANFTFSTVASALVITSASSSAITATTATITWSTDKASSSQVVCGTTPAYGTSTPVYASFGTWHSVPLTGLTPATTYHCAAISTNPGGLATSPDLTFTTASTGPVITSIFASAITATTATINWTTDQPTTSQVVYGNTVYSRYDPSLVTSHSITLLGLLPGASYPYSALSTDAAGRTTSSAISALTSAIQ